MRTLVGEMAISLVALVAQLPPVEQAHLDEARQMQALSFIVHIPLVCFGLALPSLVLFVEWLHVRTGDPLYRTLARRWSKVMVALFAVGAVTGTILSFEMGLLWPGFMGAFGDVFGLGFALEGFSFFVEAIFIAVYVYGWDRLSPRVHLLSGLPMVVAGVTGSLMVIAVNAWMQNPTGFRVRADGEIVDVRPVEALFGNPYLWPELTHMYVAGYLVTGFALAAAYALRWLRADRSRYVRTALVVPLTLASLAAPVQIVVGDWIARRVAETQPTKLAAFEGLGETTAGAPLHLGGWYDDGEVKGGIEIPKLLSLLATHDPDATVEGLAEVPEGDRPPVNLVRITFQTMVAIGTFLAALGALHILFLIRRKAMPRSRWFYRCVAAAGPLSVVALISGWVATEVGRQPWVVYGVMRTPEAVTGADGIPIGYATLVVVYVALIAATVWILRRLARVPLDLADESGGEAVAR